LLDSLLQEMTERKVDVKRTLCENLPIEIGENLGLQNVCKS